MSNNKMLIDATHPEETRVVVLRGGRVEEFDFESAARKLLRGNIYLAKVTRVEPSLQAAFVEYGGNRHGFLAFNEIHPDYYQIPVADRQALIEEEAAAEAEEEAAVDAHAEALAARRANRSEEEDDAGESETLEPIEPETHEENEGSDHRHHHHTIEASGPEDDRISEPVSATPLAESLAANENLADNGDLETADETPQGVSGETGPNGESEGGVHEVETTSAPTEVERVEQVGSAEDAMEELRVRPRRRQRSYKIQEVIKRRQVILVQVVKEERGNKGAALTTYLSLAGRYTVLMPNTARGGGISRKITQPQDRKRLKAIAAELEVPEGMGLIIRTAGAARTKQEIKRDFEYLLRLWESVRDLTLRSQAPSLVYEEGNLIKRSIRDLYNKDVDEVIVAGDEAHREAKDFMRMLMPSHAKNVTLYAEPEPLFTRFQIERQLNAMFSPYVTLRSGGYLVINQTEALVAIDVNSGKATREFSIEETALHTNAEAADEIARQLKLRDLAGLIVIDFIDMEEKRNNRTVERRLKEALRFDRARIQVGRISHFGLLEMSRQRLRTGVLEGSTSQCPHCQGTGIIRSTESVALAVLRGLEDAITAGARTPLVATTTPSVALYILNNKRPFINDMETRHGLPISVTGSDKLAGANFTIEKGAAPAQPTRRPDRGAVNMEWGFEDEGEAVVEAEVDEAPSPAGSMIEEVGDDEREERDTRSGRGERSERGGSDEQRRRGRRRRRGGGGGGGGRRDESREGSRGGAELRAGGEQPYEAGEAPDRGEPRETAEASPERAGEGEGGQPRGEERGGRSRRRGRRGGRRGRDRQPRNGGNGHDGAGEHGGEAYAHAGGEQPFEGAPSVEPRAPQAESRSRPERSHERSHERTREWTPERSPERPQTVAEAEPSQPPPRHSEPSEAAAGEPVAEKRTRHRGSSSEPRIERIVVGQANDDAGSGAAPAEPSAPARKGWWQRRLGGE